MLYEKNYVPRKIKLDNHAAPKKATEASTEKTDLSLTGISDNPNDSETENQEFESQIHAKVYKYISEKKEAVTFDEIYRIIDGDVADLSEILLDLEIEGKIKAIVGNRFEVI